MVNEVSIDSSLKDLILPLSVEEHAQLEKNLIEEGCRDPLVVWKKSNHSCILLDGHHRYEICTKHDISFLVKELLFDDIEDAKSWMINNQLGRRNLTKEQTSYYRGLKYLKLKKKKGGYDNVANRGESETTAEILSYEFKVSESTIKRDAKFAEALEIIARSNVELRNAILRGHSNLSKSDILMLLNATNPDQIKIDNEADLFNQAKVIERNLFDEIEEKVKGVEKSRLQEREEVFDDVEPIFLDSEGRIKKIKGLIISAMNRAINHRDVIAIEELKRLIESLQDLIFSEN